MKRVSMMLAGLCLAALPVGVNAQDFYAENDIQLVVGYSPGGNIDSYARLFARHLANHIPGNPNIIVQNMPGAGSLTAVRHLDAIAPTDGTVIVAFNPGLVLSGLTDPDNVQIDMRDFAWLGSLSASLRVCYTWHTSGISDWDDLAARDVVMYGGTAPGSGGYLDGAVLRNVFGINIEPVLGFPGAAEIDAAVERGEVDVSCSQWSGVSEGWKSSDEFVPLVRLADIEDPDLPDTVPYLGTLVETGEQQQILDMIFASHIIGVPYVLSEQVPEVRLTILRDAFDATISDPEFLAEAERISQPILAPLSGVEAESVVNDLYGTDPETLERVRDAVDLGS